MIKKRWWVGVIIFSLCIVSYSAFAQPLKLWKDTEHLEWFEKYKDAKPEFKPGDVITFKDADKIRPFLSPEFQDIYIFPEMKMEISETTDYPPYPAFEEATRKYGNQAKIGPKGELLNYVAGTPFPEIKLDDPQAGLKSVWNFEYRWQVGGYYISEEKALLQWRFRDGKGVDEKSLGSYHRRYYHSHRADYADSNYTPPVPEGGEVQYKEITGFTDPFDVKDTAFIIFRYLDFNKDDDGWAYVPALRRVRRVSMATRSDSLMGTDHTLDDFYGFSGKVGQNNFKLLGKKKVLAVANSKYTSEDVTKDSYKWYWYGPRRWTPNDRFELRDTYVVEIVSQDPAYPYSRKFIYWDDKMWTTLYFTAYDRKGEEWRIYQLTFSDSERVPSQKGLFVQPVTWAGCFDIQADRCTVIPVGGHDERPMDVKKVKDYYDIMRLIRGR